MALVTLEFHFSNNWSHEGEAVVHELAAGDGLLIDSEKMHNVATVTSGVRHSLVIELWVAPANQTDRFS